MKAFEKHIQKQQFSLLEYSKASREGIVAMQKIGWRAALEWIRGEAPYDRELCYIIKKELED